MSPTNTILVQASCPVCGQAAPIRCTTQVAASARGDATGPFCGRVYALGERMAWWPRDVAWRFEGEPNQPVGTALEACPAACDACGAELVVTIRFRDLTAREVARLEPRSAC